MILRVLKIAGDYSLRYKKIIKIGFNNATLVNALYTRFKKQKKANMVVGLTLEELENFIKNYSHKNPAHF